MKTRKLAKAITLYIKAVVKIGELTLDYDEESRQEVVNDMNQLAQSIINNIYPGFADELAQQDQETQMEMVVAGFAEAAEDAGFAEAAEDAEPMDE